MVFFRDKMGQQVGLSEQKGIERVGGNHTCQTVFQLICYGPEKHREIKITRER